MIKKKCQSKFIFKRFKDFVGVSCRSFDGEKAADGHFFFNEANALHGCGEGFI